MTSIIPRRLKRFVLSSFVVLLFVSCSNENIPFSSGALTGDVTPSPASWVAADSAEIIQLETQSEGGEPYSVNLWMIGKPGWVYIYAGDTQTEWVKNLEANGKARLRIDTKLFDLQASRVTDQAEFDRFALDWDQKYGSSRPQGSSINDVWLFRLFAN